MKTGFQGFQQQVRQQQQHQRRLAGGYYAMKQRESRLGAANPPGRQRAENPLVWLIKLPFRILFFLVKTVVMLAAVSVCLGVAFFVLSALFG